MSVKDKKLARRPGAGLATLAGMEVVSALRERQTVAGHIFDSLRAAIRTGVLKDGDDLNQVGLAEHFGVSRVPIREALRALEAEGWIKAPTNQRAFVQSLSIDEVSEVFEMRELIEVDLIGKAIPAINDTSLTTLEDFCDKMERAKDHETWVRNNGEFHTQLLKYSGRVVAIGVVSHLASQVERYLRPLKAGPDRRSQANAEHRMIIDALRRGDKAAARTLMRKHIRTTRKLVIDNLRRVQSK